MKNNITKCTIIISIIIMTLSLSAYSQKCKPKRVIFQANSNTITLGGITKGCTSYLIKNRKNQRLQIKLTSPSKDVYFFMNQANATKEEMEGDYFCEDCKTLDEYFNDAEDWKIWVAGGSNENRANGYALTFTLTDSPIIPSGVLNSKAISLPKPPFPKEAKEAGASGSVTVKVEVTEDGNVYYAEAISGNELFYQSAEVAARQARFKPILSNGKPARISGTIVYNFKKL
jgi:TonB family protein